MSDSTKSWFHCARCGALFLSVVDDQDERQCGECGRNPSLGVSTQIPAQPSQDRKHGAAGEEDGEDADRPAREKHRRRRRSGGLMIKLVLGWCAVMALIVLVANHFWKSDDESRAEWQRASEPARGLTDGEIDLLHRHEAECRQALAGLLAANSPESMNPFVFNSVATLPDMVRFYALNPSTRLEISELEPMGMSVIQLPDGPAIEGRWGTEDGREIDVVFRNERGNWRVDWHHFARYSDHPWPLFLAGDGPPEGEFRLLARRRLASEELTPDRPLSLVFHTPKFADPRERSTPSPEFELDLQSPPALLLIAGLRMAAENASPFSSLLPPQESNDLVRVRVRIRRIDDDQGRRFQLLDVIACHWLQLDDPGVEIDLTSS